VTALPIISVENIINGTPDKIILQAYETMRNGEGGYNEESARNYIETVKNQPLSVILDNSRKVFSETYFGYPLYESIVCNPNSCIFTRLDDEIEKVESFISDKGGYMPENQRAMYDKLLESMKEVSRITMNTRAHAGTLKEKHPDDERRIYNELFNIKESQIKDTSMINKIAKELDKAMYIIYAPYIIASLNEQGADSAGVASIINEINTSDEVTTDLLEWKKYISSVMAGNKVCNDKAYINAVNSIRNLDFRTKFTYFMNENLRDVHSITSEKVVDVNDILGYSDDGIVNSVFESFFEERSGLAYDENNVSEHFQELTEAMYEEAFDIAYEEYVHCDNPQYSLTSLSMFSESTTVAEALDFITKNIKDQSFLNRMK
jgi:hypothetical protein